MTKIDEHRAKLEALAHTHPWIREVVKELDRMKKITPLSCVNCEMGYWHQIDILEDKVDELQHRKESISRSVITENETYISNMDKDDMLALFRE